MKAVTSVGVLIGQLSDVFLLASFRWPARSMTFCGVLEV